jgi:acetoin utilization deacetylase AcuC-like enzyme
MLVVYSPQYAIDIGLHVFPTVKYALVHERLDRDARVATTCLSPAPASWEDLALVHTAEYLDRIRSGQLPVAELAQLEIPWSAAIVEGFRLMTGGTVLAARHAAERREPVFHIGGGFHHAFPNHGEGFCLFNDVAVAVRVLFAAGRIARTAVIDLDVHHGNGTAFTFADDPRVFTFSMHQERNYPAVKPPGSLDVGLADGVTDTVYNSQLEAALDRVFERTYDMVFYLAGADPYEDDQLGGLALSKDGLRARDRLVLNRCKVLGIPVVVLLAGGYARHLADTVDIHYGTALETAAL